MVAAGCGSAEQRVRSSVLRLLLAPALVCDLGVSAAESEVEGSDWELNITGGRGCGGLASDVVAELRRRPLAGCVVEHAFACYGCKGRSGIDCERLPCLQTKAASGDWF